MEAPTKVVYRAEATESRLDSLPPLVTTYNNTLHTQKVGILKIVYNMNTTHIKSELEDKNQQLKV